MPTFIACKDCSDRKLGCHSDCEKYQNEVAENEKRKAFLQRDRGVDDYIRENIYKAKNKSSRCKKLLRRERYS